MSALSFKWGRTSHNPEIPLDISRKTVQKWDTNFGRIPQFGIESGRRRDIVVAEMILIRDRLARPERMSG